MKKIILIISMFFILFSCSNKRDYLVFNLMSEPRSLDIHKNSDAISRQISNALYESLLKVDKDGKIILGIAKEYEKKENKYIFSLKDNLKYSDGSDILIDDIRDSFLRILDKENTSQYANMLFPIKNAEKYYNKEISEKELGVKIENDKLVIELEKDVSYFPYILTLPISAPYKEGKYNGAYMLESKKEQEINVIKNPFYHNKDKIDIDKIKFIYFNDYTTVNNLIKNGDIDISNVDEQLVNEKNIRSFIDGRIWYFDFNLVNKDKILNFNLRKAISLAINREEYAKHIKADGSMPAYNLIRKEFSYIPDFKISEDDILAKESLEIAKRELNLNEIELELLVGNTPTEVKEGTYIKYELEKKLGIKINVKSLPFKDRLSAIRENNYDFSLNTWSPKYDDPLAILDRFLYKSKKINLEDHMIYKNIVEKARVSNNNREKLIKEAESLLLSNYFVTPIYFSVENKYISKEIDNIVYDKIGGIIDISKIKIK